MEEFDIRKSKGTRKTNPDSKKSWKEFEVIRGKSKTTRRIKKTQNVAARNGNRVVGKEKEDLSENPMRGVRNFSSKGNNYLFEHSKPLLEAQWRRSGFFCAKCEKLHCVHRATESVILMMLSCKKRDGDFSCFPKDIIIMIAKLVYKAKLDFINYWGHSVPCLWLELCIAGEYCAW